MNPWRRFLRWLARRELREERERLDDYARMIGRQMSQPAVTGSMASLRQAITDACRDALPFDCACRVVERVSDAVGPGELRIVIERPSFPRGAA